MQNQENFNMFSPISPACELQTTSESESLNREEKLLIIFVEDEIAAEIKGNFFSIETQLKKIEVSCEAKVKAAGLAVLANNLSLLTTIYLYGKIKEGPSLEVIKKAKEVGCKEVLYFLYENGLISLDEKEEEIKKRPIRSQLPT